MNPPPPLDRFEGVVTRAGAHARTYVRVTVRVNLSTARTTMQRALTSFYSVEARCGDDIYVEYPWRTCSRTDIFSFFGITFISSVISCNTRQMLSIVASGSDATVVNGFFHSALVVVRELS